MGILITSFTASRHPNLRTAVFHLFKDTVQAARIDTPLVYSA
jgi:hypothetical protein